MDLVAQSVQERGSGDLRTGSLDLLGAFNLWKFYEHTVRSQDRNHIALAAKETPNGIPGDTSLFA
jgi:hypothetical protein